MTAGLRVGNRALSRLRPANAFAAGSCTDREGWVMAVSWPRLAAVRIVTRLSATSLRPWRKVGAGVAVSGDALSP